MKLLLSSLLLLCVCSPQSVSSKMLVVRQSRDVSVLEGQTVNISCCWTGGQSRFGVKWLKNETSVKNETVIFQSEESPNVPNHCSFLVFQRVTCSDSGNYICKVTVEIPVLFGVKGNATVVMVTHDKKIDHTDKKDHRSAEDKENTSREPSVNKVDNKRHNVADDEKTIRKPNVSTVDNTNHHISKDGENTAKKPRGAKADNKKPPISTDASQDDMFIFIMRCLPIIALIAAFFWLYYLGTKAQQTTSALGNEPTSPESKEVDLEEDGEHERKTEKTERRHKDLLISDNDVDCASQ